MVQPRSLFQTQLLLPPAEKKKRKKCFWSFKVLFLVNLHCFSQMGEGNKIKSELIWPYFSSFCAWPEEIFVNNTLHHQNRASLKKNKSYHWCHVIKRTLVCGVHHIIHLKWDRRHPEYVVDDGLTYKHVWLTCWHSDWVSPLCFWGTSQHPPHWTCLEAELPRGLCPQVNPPANPCSSEKRPQETSRVMRGHAVEILHVVRTSS